MQRSTALLCGGLLALLLFSLSGAEEEGGWSRPAMPVNPIQVDKPKNWSTVSLAECPKECSTSGCCTAAWDQLGWLLLSMPKSNCSLCRSMRYTLGAIEYDNKTETCQKCLMDDFKNMVTNFRCNNDNGKCSKCCMDLTLIYMSRFVFSCPEPVWRRFSEFNYQDTGFSYDGSSSCPAPPKRNGTVDPYDYEYWESLDPNDPRAKVRTLRHPCTSRSGWKGCVYSKGGLQIPPRQRHARSNSGWIQRWQGKPLSGWLGTATQALDPDWAARAWHHRLQLCYAAYRLPDPCLLQ
jgi:hypothetical protein